MALRSAAYFVQRYLLGRQTLLAPVPEFDLELRVPAGDEAGRHLFEEAMHAPAVIDYLATGVELAPEDVVFDIGASIGWYSLLLARLAPRGTSIHAFEPDPWTRGLLQENASRNRADAITVVGAAVGEDSRPARLHRYGARRRGRNGLLAGSRPETIDIEMVSLDDYCRQHGLADRPVGFIKIGVEGFEFFALRGALATLGRCRALLTEFSPARLEASGRPSCGHARPPGRARFCAGSARPGRAPPGDAGRTARRWPGAQRGVASTRRGRIPAPARSRRPGRLAPRRAQPRPAEARRSRRAAGFRRSMAPIRR
jgi:FkbM family methyltransferase